MNDIKNTFLDNTKNELDKKTEIKIPSLQNIYNSNNIKNFIKPKSLRVKNRFFEFVKPFDFEITKNNSNDYYAEFFSSPNLIRRKKIINQNVFGSNLHNEYINDCYEVPILEFGSNDRNLTGEIYRGDHVFIINNEQFLYDLDVAKEILIDNYKQNNILVRCPERKIYFDNQKKYTIFRENNILYNKNNNTVITNLRYYIVKSCIAYLIKFNYGKRKLKYFSKDVNTIIDSFIMKDIFNSPISKISSKKEPIV